MCYCLLASLKEEKEKTWTGSGCLGFGLRVGGKSWGCDSVLMSDSEAVVTGGEKLGLAVKEVGLWGWNLDWSIREYAESPRQCLMKIVALFGPVMFDN